jgi:hypothetical protein
MLHINLILIWLAFLRITVLSIQNELVSPYSPHSCTTIQHSYKKCTIQLKHRVMFKERTTTHPSQDHTQGIHLTWSQTVMSMVTLSNDDSCRCGLKQGSETWLTATFGAIRLPSAKHGATDTIHVIDRDLGICFVVIEAEIWLMLINVKEDR